MANTRTKQQKCVHYWIMDSPDGRTSLGRCKYCGMVNEFTNDWHEALMNLSKKGLPTNGKDTSEEEELDDEKLFEDL